MAIRKAAKGLGVLAAFPLGVLGVAACAGGAGDGGRDVVPESRDVRVAEGAGEQSYEYVARRALAVVALAEARGIEAPIARAAVDRLADALDTCATEEGRKGTLAAGAARMVAQVSPDGTVAQTSLRVDPGPGVLQDAVLCLVAPAKMLGFPPADAGARGFAVEAIWGKVAPR